VWGPRWFRAFSESGRTGKETKIITTKAPLFKRVAAKRGVRGASPEGRARVQGRTQGSQHPHSGGSTVEAGRKGRGQGALPGRRVRGGRGKPPCPVAAFSAHPEVGGQKGRQVNVRNLGPRARNHPDPASVSREAWENKSRRGRPGGEQRGPGTLKNRLRGFQAGAGGERGWAVRAVRQTRSCRGKRSVILVVKGREKGGGATGKEGVRSRRRV